MLGMMTISMAILSLVAAVVAIGGLSRVRKHLSALGKRVLESEDVGRILQAAEKTASFESRMTGCEIKANESQKKLSEHETKLSELITKQGSTEQRMNGHSSDLAKTSEKTAFFEARFGEFEKNVGDKLNQLLELETKANEFLARLESIEQTANRNEAGLAQADQGIKAVRDEIEILQKFQTATEKTHSLIQAAFADMGASMSPDEGQGITPEITEVEQISNGPEDVHQEAEDQKAPETYNLSIEENPVSWRAQ